MITTKGQKTATVLATMLGATTLATMGNTEEASANSTTKVSGVYKVDKLVQYMGKWYVVSNPIAIPTVDYNNWIPVDPLTVTHANGKRHSNQILHKGSYFTFSNKNYSVGYDRSNQLKLTMDGEPVWFKKSALKSTVGKTVSKPAAKKTNNVNKVSNVNTNKSHAVNVRQAGINGYYNGGYSYPVGQCTGFVASILAARGVNVNQIQFLGNGESWAANARNRGLHVSNKPSVGSVVSFKAQGWYAGYGHVAYVTGVNANGSFQIAEGNFAGRAYNERTVWVNNDIAGFINF